MQIPLTKAWLIDTAERVAGTFVAAFIGALVISAGRVNIAAFQAAGLAGIAAAVTVLKSVIATEIGSADSASLIPSVGTNPPLPTQPKGPTPMKLRKTAPTHGLGRVYHPDPRDAEFLMARRVPEVSPVGKKLYPVPHLYDQGQTPMCVGYSTSAAATALEAPATVVFDAARLYTYANAHDGDTTKHDGTSVRAGFQTMLAQGDAILSSTGADDPVGTMDKMASYLWADTSQPYGDIDRVITWLLTIGPVVIGIDWYNASFNPDPITGFISLAGGVAGGHAILLRGVNAEDPNNTWFVLRNSWGNWGVTVNPDFSTTLVPGGDCKISKADLITLLTAQGEAGALVDSVTPPPPPPPVVTPWLEIKNLIATMASTINHDPTPSVIRSAIAKMAVGTKRVLGVMD